MKKTNLKLPHISRIINAVTVAGSKKLSGMVSRINPIYLLFARKYLPLFVVFLYLIFTLAYPLRSFEIIRNKILSGPKNYQNHLLLSELFHSNNDFDGALKEALLAKVLNNNIETINQVKKIEEIRNRPLEINKKINYGRNLVSSYGNYRDAYLALASLSFQIMDLKAVDYYINRAIELDPNNELTNKLKTLLADQK